MEKMQINETKHVVNITPYFRQSLATLAGVALVKITRDEERARRMVGSALRQARDKYPSSNIYALRPPSKEFATALDKELWRIHYDEDAIAIMPYSQPVHLSLKYLWDYSKKHNMLDTIKETGREIGQVIMRFSGNHIQKMSAIKAINTQEVIVYPDMLGRNPDPSNHLPVEHGFEHIYIIPPREERSSQVISLYEHNPQ